MSNNVQSSQILIDLCFLELLLPHEVDFLESKLRDGREKKRSLLFYTVYWKKKFINLCKDEGTLLGDQVRIVEEALNRYYEACNKMTTFNESSSVRLGIVKVTRTSFACNECELKLY